MKLYAILFFDISPVSTPKELGHSMERRALLRDKLVPQDPFARIQLRLSAALKGAAPLPTPNFAP
jgi:hypothetical protein